MIIKMITLVGVNRQLSRVPKLNHRPHIFMMAMLPWRRFHSQHYGFARIVADGIAKQIFLILSPIFSSLFADAISISMVFLLR